MARPRNDENKANAQLIQDAIDARRLGLSYGMYSAYCDLGLFHRNYVNDKEINKNETKQD